jgi:toxin ParE1/3/4
MARKAEGFRLSRRAAADLEAIYDYTAKTWSAAQAERYTHDLEAAIQGLVTGSRVGRRREDLGEDLHSLLVGSHLVIYRESNAYLLVARILHGSMDHALHLGQ